MAAGRNESHHPKTEGEVIMQGLIEQIQHIMEFDDHLLDHKFVSISITSDRHAESYLGQLIG